MLRLWAQPHRLTVAVAVTDSGDGPTDPFVGLLPAGHGDQQPDEPGLGLWISHQLDDVTHRRHAHGYTIRITASGEPPRFRIPDPIRSGPERRTIYARTAQEVHT